jgi:hypothetical protein
LGEIFCAGGRRAQANGVQRRRCARADFVRQHKGGQHAVAVVEDKGILAILKNYWLKN